MLEYWILKISGFIHSYLAVAEDEEIAKIHFSGVADTPHPRSWTLLSHFLTERLQLEKWQQKAFLWERRQLCRQLALYYHCLGDNEQSLYYQALEKKEYLHGME